MCAKSVRGREVTEHLSACDFIALLSSRHLSLISGFTSRHQRLIGGIFEAVCAKGVGLIPANFVAFLSCNLEAGGKIRLHTH